MEIGRDIIGSLAKQFGYSKQLVRDALQSNQIDPLTASMVGNRIDRMQQSKQQAASRTTVLEDVLAPKPEEVAGQGIAAAPQQAPTALAALPSNLPAQGMAGGGIVAFAEGGDLDIDDDEDEATEKSTLSQLMGGLSSGLASLKSLVPQGRGIAIPQSYEAALAEKGQTPASARKLMIEGPKKGDYVMPPLDSKRPGMDSARRGHPLEDRAIAAADQVGLDRNLMLHALYKETGGLKDPSTAVSKKGAYGPMQIMPATAKELGINIKDTDQNLLGGAMYLKKMMDKYQDPTLALAAYNAGPGRVDKALKSGQGIAALPRETQNYVVASRMAGGGIVAFQNTGLVDTDYQNMDPLGGIGFGSADQTRMAEAKALDEIRRQAAEKRSYSSMLGYKKPGEKPAPTVPTKKTFSDEDEGPYTGQAPAPGVSQEQIDKLIASTKPEEKEDGLMKKYMSLLEGREKASADQRKTDAYLSLLSAGLGIMGGTSPFAATNIGQGAQTGIATQMAARKAQIADEAATLKGFGTAAAAEEYAKQRKLLTAQAQESKIGNLIANREKQIETAAYNAIKGNMSFSLLDPAQQQTVLNNEVQRIKSSDPLLTKLYQQYGLPAIPTSTAPSGPVDYVKQFGITPKKPQ